MSEYGRYLPGPETEGLFRVHTSGISGRRELQWFALSVKPRFDKAVGAALEIKGFETFLALYKKRNTYASRTREVELPIFPGYVFCRFDLFARLPILTTSGVIQILGSGNTPEPVSDAELASLRTAIQAQVSVQPFPFPPVGQKVYIDKGALAGIQGTVVSVKQSPRIVLSITLLQRSVLLETDWDQVSMAPGSDHDHQPGASPAS